MSNLTAFLKQNKKTRPNFFYPATKSITDENGKPIEWEFKPISTKDSEDLRVECTINVPVKGKAGQFKQELDTKKYLAKLIVKATVFPDLYDKQLQDSYGVKTPEDLIREIVDSPTEYSELVKVIQDSSDLNENLNDKVEKAKN